MKCFLSSVYYLRIIQVQITYPFFRVIFLKSPGEAKFFCNLLLPLSYPASHFITICVIYLIPHIIVLLIAIPSFERSLHAGYCAKSLRSITLFRL